MDGQQPQKPALRDPRREILERGGYGGKPDPSTPFSVLNIQGFIETVTVIPTAAPRSFYDSVKLYTDSLTAPTVRRLYLYSRELSDWLYVALST